MSLYFGLTVLAAWGSSYFSAGSSIQPSVGSSIANDTFADARLSNVDPLNAESWPIFSSNDTANRRLSNDALRSFGVYWIHTPKSGIHFSPYSKAASFLLFYDIKAKLTIAIHCTVRVVLRSKHNFS